MNDGISGSALAGLVKAYGFKAVLGMVGAALLYVVLPPLKNDGSYNKTEFVLRLAAAGLFSTLFGDWAVQLFMEFLPRLHAENHKGAVYLMAGAPGWWISRAVALAMYRRRGKDIVEVVQEAKEVGGLS